MELRKRDTELGAYVRTNCPQVEMLSNGKKRKTLPGNWAVRKVNSTGNDRG
jgi:DNA-damage-inducible protein D